MIDEIIKEVASEQNLPVGRVDKSVRSVFSFIRECIESRNPIRLTNFGSFDIKKARQKAWDNVNAGIDKSTERKGEDKDAFYDEVYNKTD